MRQNLVIVGLSVCCTLLAVNLYVLLQSPDRAAFGQGAAVPTGTVAMAAVQNSSQDANVYIYDVASQRLALYAARNRGIELKGLRQITWDLQLVELPGTLVNRPLPVSAIRKELEKQGGGR